MEPGARQEQSAYMPYENNASSTPSSSLSVVPLHRDALHSVFAFLGREPPSDSQSHLSAGHPFGLREYASAAAVCRSWRDAVYSTSLGRAQVRWRSDQQLRQIAASSPPLLRCIDRVAFGSGVIFEDDTALRQWFASALSNLRHLHCTVSLRDSFAMSSSKPIAWNLHLPPHLHTLEIDLRGVNDPTCRDRFYTSMASIVDAGHQLVSLKLHVPYFFHGVSPLADADPAVLAERFAWVPLLTRLTRLQTFTLNDRRANLDQYEWPSEAIEILRGMPALTHIDCFAITPESWRRFTAKPHALQLQSLPDWSCTVPFSDVGPLEWLPECIRHLPGLTTLTLGEMPLERDSAILRHLPSLRFLDWGKGHLQNQPPELELFVCTELRTLRLRGSRLTDRQLCEILPCMPHLQSLSLYTMPRIRSLRFLASSPRLQSTLTDLHLEHIFLPSREFLSSSCPVRHLRSLYSLVLVSCIPCADTARVYPLVDPSSPAYLGPTCWPHMGRNAIQAFAYDESRLPLQPDPLDDEEKEEDAREKARHMAAWKEEIEKAHVCEEDQLAALTDQAAASPAVRANRRALHGILSFLGDASSSGIAECAWFAQVSRAWRDAAYTASSAVGHAQLSLQPCWQTLRRGEPIDPVTAALPMARLRRCIRSARVGFQLHHEHEDRHRELLVDALPHLREFECSVHLGQRPAFLATPQWQSERLQLPSRLERLTLYLDFRSRARAVNLPPPDATRFDQCLANVVGHLCDQLAGTLVELNLDVQGLRPDTSTGGSYAGAYDDPYGDDEDNGEDGADEFHPPPAPATAFDWIAPLARLTRLQRFSLIGYAHFSWPTRAIDILRGLTNLTHVDCFGRPPYTMAAFDAQTSTPLVMSSTTSARVLRRSLSRPFNVPREVMWQGLMDKIRAPEKHAGSRDVQILDDTPDFVRRRMVVGPPHAPMSIQDRITWSESQGLVRFTVEDDANKTGTVDNIISDQGGQLTLTFAVDWQFTDAAKQSMVDLLQRNFDVMAATALGNTIEVVENAYKEQHESK